MVSLSLPRVKLSSIESYTSQSSFLEYRPQGIYVTSNAAQSQIGSVLCCMFLFGDLRLIVSNFVLPSFRGDAWPRTSGSV